jgi:uncharacterized protein with PQ loop repeat
MELIGWLGSILFAICAAPQAWKSYKDGHSDGLATSFLVMCYLGEVLTLIYVWPTGNMPLIFNYVMNLIFLSVMAWYKLPKWQTYPDINTKEYYDLFLQNGWHLWQQNAANGDHVLYYHKEDWAPGLVYGTENYPINFMGVDLKIKEIDFEKRTITLTKKENV